MLQWFPSFPEFPEIHWISVHLGKTHLRVDNLFRERGHCIVWRRAYFTLPLYIKQFEQFVSECFPRDAIEDPVDAVVQVLHDVHEDSVVRMRWFTGPRAEHGHGSRQQDKRNGNSDQHGRPPGGRFI